MGPPEGSLPLSPQWLRLADMTKNVPDTPNCPRIALIAYEGAQMSAVLGLGDLVDVANRYAQDIGRGQMTYSILRPSDLPSDLPSGPPSDPPSDLPCDLPSDPTFDAIVIPPNLTGVRGQSAPELRAWIIDQHKRGATLCSACAGAFWLGHAGVLDGRSVTTHWALEGEFRAAFPQALLYPEHLLIDDHDIVTAGGVMAWVDLGLYLIRRWFGPAIVTQTCRHMLIDPQGREQRNYRSFRPKLDHNDAIIRDLQRWMEENAASNLSVAALARRASLSDRTLQRRFSAATGMSIRRYVQELRIEKARSLLERTNTSISEICWAVGYEDKSAFSRLFKSISGLSANDYRKRFSTR